MGCKTSRGDFFYLPRVSFLSSLNGFPADPLLSLFFFVYLLVEWQEVTKRFPATRLGIERGLLVKRLLQAV